MLDPVGALAVLGPQRKGRKRDVSASSYVPTAGMYGACHSAQAVPPPALLANPHLSIEMMRASVGADAAVHSGEDERDEACHMLKGPQPRRLCG
ncbi:MAG: hypothetical protein QW520_05915 [Methanomassiliicoccales archaeon]